MRHGDNFLECDGSPCNRSRSVFIARQRSFEKASLDKSSSTSSKCCHISTPDRYSLHGRSDPRSTVRLRITSLFPVSSISPTILRQTHIDSEFLSVISVRNTAGRWV